MSSVPPASDLLQRAASKVFFFRNNAVTVIRFSKEALVTSDVSGWKNEKAGTSTKAFHVEAAERKIKTLCRFTGAGVARPGGSATTWKAGFQEEEQRQVESRSQAEICGGPRATHRAGDGSFLQGSISEPLDGGRRLGFFGSTGQVVGDPGSQE